ncbi:MAG: ABC transporter substrate-binding protein [Planctomycetes bacterium]|nr:ABC transporter substrate-binding protein [Planctomycetota bacterium]MCB9884371.1 ABC transporter substrate-binding protein [Planctomycetota bacterium]
MSRRPVLALLVLTAVAVGCRRGAPRAAPSGPPTRIVAASVFAAEVLLDLLPRERIAGVHYLAADPRYSLVADRVGDLPQVDADPEALLSVDPDLVVLDAFTKPETVSLLEAAGVRLLRPHEARDFAGIWANIRQLSTACGCEAAAERLIASSAARLAALRETAPERAAWRVMSLDGALHTYGKGSLFDAVVAATGARNLAAEEGVGPFRKLDVEAVLVMPADAIVLGAGTGDLAQERQWLVQHPGLRLMNCVERDRLLFVPSPLLASTSHHLVAAAERIAEQLTRWGTP